LPINFPPWQTVYGYFNLWVKLAVWEQINAVLVKDVRTMAERDRQPSLGIIDSQSVKLAQKGVAGAWRLPPGKEATLRGRKRALTGTKRSKGASVTSSLM
jgi:transposase